MTRLLDLSPELLHAVLAHVDAADLAAVALTCRLLRAVVEPASNFTLWRIHFHLLFDALELCKRQNYAYEPPRRVTVERTATPSSSRTSSALDSVGQNRDDQSCRRVNPSNQDEAHERFRKQKSMLVIDYATLLQNRVQARQIICSSKPSGDKLKHRHFVLSILHNVLMTASHSASGHSKNAAYLDDLCLRPDMEWLLAQRAPIGCYGPSEDTKMADQAAHLHLASLSLDYALNTPYKSALKHREAVYKVGNFTPRNEYGPFHKRQRPEDTLCPDWKLLDSIAIILSLSVRSAWQHWAPLKTMGMIPYGCQRAVEWQLPVSDRDWAGVEGMWRYTYSFLDYHRFHEFNFARQNNSADGAKRSPTLRGLSEAVGGVRKVKLRLLESSEEDMARAQGSLFPPLKYEGEVIGENTVGLRGMVQMLDYGYRRWSQMVHFEGEDRWQHECVEIGGRGVYGCWTDATHGPASPCGPVQWFRDREEMG